MILSLTQRPVQKILLRAIEHGYEIGENIEGDEVKVLSEAVMSVIDTIMRDGTVEADEIHSASEWLHANSDAAAVWPGIALKATLDKILEDGSINDSELADFHELLLYIAWNTGKKKTRAFFLQIQAWPIVCLLYRLWCRGDKGRAKRSCRICRIPCCQKHY